MIRITNRPRRRFEIDSDSDKAPIEISSDGNDEVDEEIDARISAYCIVRWLGTWLGVNWVAGTARF